MIHLEDAVALVLEGCAPLAPRLVPLADAGGCALAELVRAGAAVPPFDNSAMDGYAVRAHDTAGASGEAPVRLLVVGEVAAGAAATVEVPEGGAVRIMTGAPMPPGADAIVMVERTERIGDDAVAIGAEALVGDHVRRAGDDVAVGDEVLGAGTVLGPAQLGALASVGVAEVLVHPRPRVGVLSTGDELVVGGGALGPGQIHESNRVTLLAAVAQLGFDPIDLGTVRDDEDEIAAVLRSGAARCDALLTSGGVSMGDYDLLADVLATLGTVRWVQIAIRPAKPFAFGCLADGDRSVPVFGLPGNPVSSLVSLELLAAPGLRSIAGHRSDALHRVPVRAVAGEDLHRHPDGKVHYLRVVIDAGADGAWIVRRSGGQGSHQLAAMAAADGLVVLPDGDGVGAGSPVEVLVLRWPTGPGAARGAVPPTTP